MEGEREKKRERDRHTLEEGKVRLSWWHWRQTHRWERLGEDP